MGGALYQYFADDHRRLGHLLDQAAESSTAIDIGCFDRFRSGILKHIGLEEKILLPAVRRYRNGEPLPVAGRIRLDHGAIAALLVPPPSERIISALQRILSTHNILEESRGGLYELCEQLAGDDVGSLMKQVQSAKEVPVMPYNTDPKVLDATIRAVERAGYKF